MERESHRERRKKKPQPFVIAAIIGMMSSLLLAPDGSPPPVHAEVADFNPPSSTIDFTLQPRVWLPFVVKGWPDYFRMMIPNYNAAAFVNERNTQHVYNGCAAGSYAPGLACVWYHSDVNASAPLPSECSPLMMWLNEPEINGITPQVAATKSQTLLPAIEKACGSEVDILVGGFVQAGTGGGFQWAADYLAAGGLLDLDEGETGGWHYHYYIYTPSGESVDNFIAARANFESVLGEKSAVSEWAPIVHYPSATQTELDLARGYKEYMRDSPPGLGEAYFEDVKGDPNGWPGAGLSTALLDSAGSNPNRTQLGCIFSDVFGRDLCNLTP